MKLGLGTAQFGFNYGIANAQGRVSTEETKAILAHSLSKKISLLDTAIAYGESESVLGEIGIEEWQIVTKLPIIPEDTNLHEWIKEAVENSFRKLKVKKIYGLLLHRPEQLLSKSGNEIYRSLLQLKSDGLVNKIGISIYSPDELDKLYSYYNFDLIQTPFNILDRRMIDSGWLERLHSENVEIHARSVFLQGLLLMPSQSRPKFFAKWNQLFKIWDDWLQTSSLSPIQACLSYALAFKEINKVIVGVDSKQQLDEIINLSSIALPELPSRLKTTDIDLLNPAHWKSL